MENLKGQLKKVEQQVKGKDNQIAQAKTIAKNRALVVMKGTIMHLIK